MTKVLVTGGGGFVMANFLRRWLEADPWHHAVAIDAGPLDAAAQAWFAPVASRLQFVTGDVTDPQTWAGLPADFDGVVHGAAVTPHAFTDRDGRRREPERENPVRVIDVNIMGTARALDWARGLKGLKRFVYVSTGSVYVDEVPAQKERFFPLPEDGYVGPTALYDVSKYSSELIALRFRQLYGLDLAIVRLSSVFGPMDRQTPARGTKNLCNYVANAAAQGRALTADSDAAVGDYVYAPDVADGILRLLLAPKARVRHDVYNLAQGETSTVRDLVNLATKVVPSFRLEIVPAAQAEMQTVPDRKTGKWAAYDIGRAARDLDWRPRALGANIADYIGWLRRQTQPEGRN
ncbi:MAG TPA: NAD-dependent epimerase/dehydratase family protein [Dongiaceae bacterium]|nr:NAD-dependent epimerase/dehydratase family protein [Dongiaceae bacterium]